MKTKKKVMLSLITTGLVVASGCNGGSQGSAPATTPTAPAATTVTASQFVAQLVSDAQSGATLSGYAGSTLEKQNALQPGFFVIYDSATKENMAVNLGWAEVEGETTEQIVQTFVQEDQHLDGNSSFNNGSTPGSMYVYVPANGYTYTVEMTGSPFLTTPTSAAYQYPLGVPLTDQMGNIVQVSPDPQNPNSGVYTDGNGELYSRPGQTRDTDLQQAQLQNKAFLQRAALVSTSYSMSFTSALQLSLIADKINTVTEQQLTDDDRQAITKSVLGIAGVSSDDISKAVTASMQGDETQANALIATISKNLGMPSETPLKSQILPKLGLNL